QYRLPMNAYIDLEAVIEQHHLDLPWYVTLPERELSALGTPHGTTTIEGTIDGVDLGRRGMKAWGPGTAGHLVLRGIEAGPDQWRAAGSGTRRAPARLGLRMVIERLARPLPTHRASTNPARFLSDELSPA